MACRSCGMSYRPAKVQQTPKAPKTVTASLPVPPVESAVTAVVTPKKRRGFTITSPVPIENT